MTLSIDVFLLSREHWRFLLEGGEVTLTVTGLSVVLGTVIGLLGGIASLSSIPPLRWAVRVYVEVFRGVSVIILLFWLFFALPQLMDISLSPMQAGVLAIGTNMGAYATELFRGAIQAVPSGQSEASLAVNLSNFQRYRYVVLPQALVSLLPPYGNLLIEELKASALVAVIGLNDIMFQSQRLRSARSDSTFDIFMAALLLYFAIAMVSTYGIRLLEIRFSRGMEIGRGARGG